MRDGSQAKGGRRSRSSRMYQVRVASTVDATVVEIRRWLAAVPPDARAPWPFRWATESGGPRCAGLRLAQLVGSSGRGAAGRDDGGSRAGWAAGVRAEGRIYRSEWPSNWSAPGWFVADIAASGVPVGRAAEQRPAALPPCRAGGADGARALWRPAMMALSRYPPPLPFERGIFAHH